MMIFHSSNTSDHNPITDSATSISISQKTKCLSSLVTEKVVDVIIKAVEKTDEGTRYIERPILNEAS